MDKSILSRSRWMRAFWSPKASAATSNTTHSNHKTKTTNTTEQTFEISKPKLQAFANEIDQLKKQVFAKLGPEDITYIKGVERRGLLASFVGYSTACLIANPISALLISFGILTRWAIAHHVMHRGYDKTPNIPKRFTSKHFARKWRRLIDWFDWQYPEAWEHEHNTLHHYDTGGSSDPDLVERHMEFLRNAPINKPAKYFFMFMLSITWRWSYYAPNTISVLFPQKATRKLIKKLNIFGYYSLLNFKDKRVKELWLRSFLPYGIGHFVLLPLLFLPLGTTAVLNVFLTIIMAEFFACLHSFLIIVPNHTAADLHRFNCHFNNKAEFYLVQVLGSANYRTGGSWNDHLHMWLNYQIEHHLIPDLPMNRYAEIQPEIKRLCQQYQIPYLQESVFTRARKMLRVCVGTESMRQVDRIPVVEPR